MARKYNLPRSTINSWESELRRKIKKVSIHKKGVHLRAGSGHQLSYPKEIDEELVEWVLVRRDCHLPAGTQMIRGKVASLIKAYNPSFKASKGWLSKFMLHNGLSMCLKTFISQKLPAQLEKHIESFFTRIRALRAEHQYPLDLITNMDETPLYFDLVPQHTISKKGVKQVPIRSSDAEKRRLTVTLACTGSGDMLSAYAIFKGKRKLKFIPPRGVKIAVQKKVRMDALMMLEWFKSIILPYTKGRRSLLIIDSFSAHEDTTLHFLRVGKC